MLQPIYLSVEWVLLLNDCMTQTVVVMMLLLLLAVISGISLLPVMTQPARLLVGIVRYIVAHNVKRELVCPIRT